MSHWMRKLHKWIGLIIALQFLLWMGSGVVMSLLDASKVQGKEFRIKPSAPPNWPRDALDPSAVLAKSSEGVSSVTSGWVLNRPVYVMQGDKRSWLVGAVDGRPFAIDAALAGAIARASYSGKGQARTARLLDYSLEARAHKEPVWRIDFDDADETTVYVSARSGKVPAPTAADRALLPSHKLDAGYRLACGLSVGRGIDIDVGDPSLLATDQTAVVAGVKALTPFLREISLRPARPLACRPGAYVQVHVPAYARDASHIDVPDDHRDDWHRAGTSGQLVNDAPLRRSYSVAVPVERADGHLVFLVRFMPGERPGRGSSYMYTLKPGDTVSFSGPYGDFALKPGAREKVFIGGGAGMAPLRAMIHALFAQGASEPVHFWYGARSRRDAPYVDEMAALAARHPNFDWRLVLSEEGGAGPASFVHEAVRDGLLRDHPNLASLEFYVCGPPAMLAATRRMLQELGVDDGMVAFDDFKV